MRTIAVLPTPTHPVPGGGPWLPVVIDLLRATTTIITALDAGALSVLPVKTVEEARPLSAIGYMLAGERQAVRPQGFSLGNSPLEMTPAAVRGQRLALTTTNGTRAFHAAKVFGSPYAMALINLSATAQALRDETADILVFCSGNHDLPCQDDTYAAGALVHSLGADFTPCPEASAARNLFLQHDPAHHDFLVSTSHGRKLAELGFASDVVFCAQFDSHPRVVRMLGDQISLK